MPEGEEEEQEIENLFEKKVMKENFPNLAKEMDITRPVSTESPKQFGSKEDHTKTPYN